MLILMADYVTGEYLRMDVVEDQEGIPVHLEYQYIDVSTCEAATGLYLETWRANATGVYSGIVASGNGVGTSDPSNINNTFFRSVTEVDNDGYAYFDTIFVGHYADRASHIHNQNGTVYSNGTYQASTISHVGQLFFPTDLKDVVEAIYPYNTNTQAITTNYEDMWAPDQADNDYDPFPDYAYLGSDISDGLLMWISVGVNMGANYSSDVSVAAHLTADGGVVNSDSADGSSGGSGSGNDTMTESGAGDDTSSGSAPSGMSGSGGMSHGGQGTATGFMGGGGSGGPGQSSTATTTGSAAVSELTTAASSSMTSSQGTVSSSLKKSSSSSSAAKKSSSSSTVKTSPAYSSSTHSLSKSSTKKHTSTTSTKKHTTFTMKHTTSTKKHTTSTKKQTTATHTTAVRK